MSFQDIGRKSNPSSQFNNNSNSGNQSAGISPTSRYRRGASAGTGTGNVGIGNSNGVGVVGQPISMSNSNGEGSNEYSSISQAILQYQQNVGILSNIIQSIGTTNTGTAQETQLLTQQYNLQTDVIQQLSSKIQLQLEQIEKQNNSTNANNSNRNSSQLQQHRATHLKLTRDYKWVETKYKNVQMDAKRRWDAMRMEQRRILEEQERKNFEEGLDHDTERLQMQLRDDRIVEEIMREREEEVRNINKGMHQVNEIYKDLANIVSYQQDQIDEVEVSMEHANKTAESGLKQIEKAHAKANESTCIIS
mmetsp:Transcript_15684/g.23547  ORF Transcript_15684/g.23547 Transcript_15684/m.23547 type:complete len:306 (+) Transcript_15684:299-1216(+)|eukprot:CAMPEP_0203666426 /NCGR_PEP_ID=MMETSP0090-20130426/3462_1 /ASSEMBLY_ACC=CAM_ASM_001088 /TAXON_ID=426623 /ORGANISM="Chaetoceros affinis, Strain CCMP159" /LENGTH=305 /DNA_ID=CAMNT_0050530301 /DNA_START=284 /DNA_END=1201 /DNA_ORIENTATION=-